MKIFTVFTGGTISCSSEGGVLSPDGKNGYRLLEAARQAGLKAEFETAQPYTVLSENLSAENLRALRACVEDAVDRGFKKIIVTHGTDTLQYTAAYLDYVLGAGDLTVVLVSANYPLADARSNGLANFLAAASLLQTDETGVFVAYRNTGDGFAAIHRGREVMPHKPYDDSLESFSGEPFGFVRDGAFEKNPAYEEGEREDLSGCELSDRVVFLRAYVGMTFPEVPSDTKAVLLEGYHSGTLPTSSAALRAFCGQLEKKGVPVFLTGCAEGFNYASKREYDGLKINVLPPSPPTAAYMRLWLL